MFAVRKTFISLIAFAAALAMQCAASEEEAYVYDPWYVGASGGMLLPGNGNSLKRAASVSLHAGRYLTETFAIEAAVASAPHVCAGRAGAATLTSVDVGALLHFTYFTFYDRLFGSERLDPFFAFGVNGTFASRHVFAHDTHRTGIGPYAGIGTFYHLTDSWSIRAEARAALCCDSPCGMLYAASLGLQYSFGADE